ncbi:MAG TPA: ABC transporter permease [Vicinamibacterales bacterium]|nr:ABC transporter permease [Vicinamibacterales bacterium]
MRAAIDGTLSDIRYAWRVLRRSPGFTFFAVLTIALGLGANAAIFSLVDGVLLKSIGYPHPERIVLIWEKPPGGLRNGIAAANYIDWRQQSHSFEAMAATTGATMSYSASPSSSSASGEPRSLRVGVVSAPYFDVFGVQAALGRTFARNEDQRGHEKVTVLSHRLWLNLFGADPAIVGHDILLNGEPYTVIGVMPANSEFDRRASDLWIPLAFPPQVARDYHFLSAVARLKPDVSFQQAQAEMSAIAARIAELYPAVKKGWGATVDRYVDRIVGPQMRLSLTVLMSAVVAVLLIGCANLANLMMARATLRSREITLRLALGARRGRLIRMLLTESLLLSSIGAVLGIGFGYLLLRGIQSLLPPFYFPAEANVGMDGRVLVFLAAVTILTSVGFGLSPAVQASRQSTAEALKEGGRASSAGRRALYTRHVFVALQVAIAFILLAGAGVLIRSFQRVMNVDTGYNIEGMVAAYLPLSSESDPNVAQLTQYIQQILDEVRAIPGVREAAVATAIPLRGWGDGMPFRMASKPDEEVGTGFKIVTPRYFQTLGLRLVAGRLLDDRDTAGSMPVVVVNESFVRRYSPNDSAIGQQILVEKILPSRRGLGPRVAWEIVGVVADEKGSGLENPTDVGAYASFAQNPVVGLGLVARGSGEGGALIKSMQRAVWRVNKTQVLDRPMTVEQLKSDSMSGRRLPTMLLSGFAVLAMLLACAGIYGVLSFVTAKRTQELGIRAALGASRWDLLRMVVGGGAIPVLAGIAVGLGGAVALSRFIESLLFQTSPIDVPSLAAVAVVFLAIALTACLVPAWRAARIDPMSALRQE